MERCKDKGNIHYIHIRQIVENSSPKENICIKEKKIIVIVTRPMQPNSNKKEKR